MRARQYPHAPDLRLLIAWWFNPGGVGGGSEFTLPISTYLDCRDWFSYPWGIGHEMLHGLGYGHTHELDRLDRDVQERLAQFQWWVADHPDYTPEDWDEPPRP